MLEAARHAAAALRYEHAGIHFINVWAGDLALTVRLFEPIEPGSSIDTLSDLDVLVPARSVRLVDVTLPQRGPFEVERRARIGTSAA